MASPAQATIVPCVRNRDATAATEWLCQAWECRFMGGARGLDSTAMVAAPQERGASPAVAVLQDDTPMPPRSLFTPTYGRHETRVAKLALP